MTGHEQDQMWCMKQDHCHKTGTWSLEQYRGHRAGTCSLEQDCSHGTEGRSPERLEAVTKNTETRNWNQSNTLVISWRSDQEQDMDRTSKCQEQGTGPGTDQEIEPGVRTKKRPGQDQESRQEYKVKINPATLPIEVIFLIYFCNVSAVSTAFTSTTETLQK